MDAGEGPSKLDWMCMRYAAIAEGRAAAAVAREFRIAKSTLSSRRRRERWSDPDEILKMPSTEEIIIMRNQREIMRILEAMERKLEAATDTAPLSAEQRQARTDALNAQIAQAAAHAELLGKRARAAQFLTRASDIAAATRRKIKVDASAAKAARPLDCGDLLRKILDMGAILEASKYPVKTAAPVAAVEQS